MVSVAEWGIDSARNFIRDKGDLCNNSICVSTQNASMIITTNLLPSK